MKPWMRIEDEAIAWQLDDKGSVAWDPRPRIISGYREGETERDVQ